MEAKIQISEEELEPVVRRLLVKLLAEERAEVSRPDEELTVRQVAEINRRHVDAPLARV
jgi:hypothetical protein